MTCACHPRMWALVAFAIVTLTGCGDVTRPVAAASPASSPPTQRPRAPAFPALSRRGVIYRNDDAMYGVTSSRYVFYKDRTFALQFSSVAWGEFEYTGRFTRTDSLITFDWDGWSLAGPWGATGTLHGDSLSVAYNTVMQLNDFTDGVYVRVPEP